MEKENKDLTKKDCPHCGRCPVCGRKEVETPYCPCYSYYHYPWYPRPYPNPWDSGATWTLDSNSNVGMGTFS